jgi:hypothetical protein
LLNFELLSKSIKFLYKKENLYSEVPFAQEYLELFLKGVKNLYSESIITLKFHSILHLVTNVMDFGPLSEFSCCQGEDVNGKMTRQIFGTKNVINQLLNRFINYTLLKLMSSCSRDSLDRDIEESKVGEILERFQVVPKKKSGLWKDIPNYNNFSYKPNLSQVDVFHPKIASQLKEILDCRSIEKFHIYKFYQIRYKMKSFYSKKYDSKKRSSSFCTYMFGGVALVGRINYFLMISETNQFFACIRNIDYVSAGKLYYEVIFKDEYHLVDLQNLRDQMFVCNVNNKIFVGEYDATTFSISPVEMSQEFQKKLKEEEVDLNNFCKIQKEIWKC